MLALIGCNFLTVPRFIKKMDAHIAVTIASYLSVNASNIFFAVLGLTEHVITHTMAESPVDHLILSPSRRLEIIRRLDHPVKLIIATCNYHAAVEWINKCGVNDPTIITLANILTDFDRLSKYTQIYPRGVTRVIFRNKDRFVRYITLVGIDMRYVDLIGTLPDEIRRTYLADPRLPKWSLNYHQAYPTLENLVNIITRVRESPYTYRMVEMSDGYYLVYLSFSVTVCSQQNLFKRHAHRFVDVQDDLLELMRATFEIRAECGIWLRNIRGNIDDKLWTTIRGCIGLM